MHAEDRTLGVVFETTVRLLVPLFQQPYVWKEGYCAHWCVNVKNVFFVDKNDGLEMDTFCRQAKIMWGSFLRMGFRVFYALLRYKYWARVLVVPVFL